ncbi:hypothetical protein GGX14DRAFT_587364, partial [Mycena pura]
TNEVELWLDELRCVMRAAGWDMISTSRDLQLDAEQTDVSTVVDIELARKAAVLMG